MINLNLNYYDVVLDGILSELVCINWEYDMFGYEEWESVSKFPFTTYSDFGSGGAYSQW